MNTARNLSSELLQAAGTLAQAIHTLMPRRNVVACGVGYKRVGEQSTGMPSIMVSVTEKKPAADLDPADLVPSALGSIPTDVIETGPIRALAVDRRSRLRPVRPGISIGHQDGTAGTLGALVRRGDEVFMLSNNHVLAMLNQANLEDAILQPGPGDGGSLLDQVGYLAEFVPLHFLGETTPADDTTDEPQGCSAFLARGLAAIQGLGSATTAQPVAIGPAQNTVDAALAKPLDNIELDPSIVDIGGPPLGVIEPELGARVIKSGRSTGLTQGTIMQVNVTVDVSYGESAARFTNQIMATPLSQRGDSGSLVLDYERNAVGLLFSGSDMVTVVNPIQSVLEAFRVELVTDDL